MSRPGSKKSWAKNLNQELTVEAAAKRLAVAVVDVPDLGRAWTVRDVVDLQRDRPQWLCCSRGEAVLARRATVGYPVLTEAAAVFARDFAKVNLLNYLREALNAYAADTEVWDCGYDVSTHARRADETNRQRAKHGVSLSVYGQRSAKTKRLRATVAAETGSGVA